MNLGPEWKHLADEADDLLHYFPGKSPQWWAALNAALSMEILDHVMTKEQDSDDEPWKGK